MSLNRNRERLPFCILIEKLIKYENNETREQIENEYNLEKNGFKHTIFQMGGSNYGVVLIKITNG